MPKLRHQRSPLEVALYIVMTGLLGLALLITLWPDLNPSVIVPKALASREHATLQGGTWTTYANGDAVQAMAIKGDDLWVGTYLGGLVRWNTTEETYVQYLYPQSGLSHNNVRAVAIDSLGRVWAGTDRGLVVVSADGSSIVVHNTGNSRLPADVVMDVKVAADSKVWVATEGGGVGVLDDKGTSDDLSDDEWTIYGTNVLPSYLATAIAFDEVGNVWIGTKPYPNPSPEGPATIGGGVCLFDGTRCSTYTTENSTMGSNVVMTLHPGGGNKIWVATRGGGVTLFQGKTTSQTFNKANSGLAGNYVLAIARDIAGKMWFAVSDSSGVGQGVSILSDGSWATLTKSGSPLVSNNVSAIIADNSRRIWFGIMDIQGGKQGVNVLGARGTNWTTYNFSTSRIPSEKINSIIQDSVGDLWFGSNGQGALQYMRAFNRWRAWDRNTTGGGLPSNVVRDMYLDQLGRLWMATDKGGSVRTGSWIAYTRDSTQNKLRSEDIRTVAVDNAGKVWFGHAQGIDQVDHRGTLSDFTDDTWWAFTAVLPGMNVRDIARDASNRMWVATNGGVGVFNGTQWTTYRTADGLASNKTQVVFPDARGGKVWVGTEDGGVSVWDGSTWTTYTTADGLTSNNVQAIHVDGWGRVWFGTSQGVTIKDGDVWTSYTRTNSGLVANDVTSIQVDGWGFVWLGTRLNGVSKFDNSIWDGFAFADHGLPSNHITDIAFGADGSLWVGTADSGLSTLRETAWTSYSRATTNNQLASDKVRSIAIAADGRVWVGTLPFISGGQWTGGGVSVLDPKSGTWTTYNRNNTGTTGLKGNFIQKVVVDAAGRVWIGTGVPRGEPTTTLGYGLTVNNLGAWITYQRGLTGLSSDRIPDISIDSQGRIWLATQPYVAGAALVGGGVTRLNLGPNGVPDLPAQGDDVWTSWKNDDGSGLVALVGKGDMSAIHVDRADTAWAGAWTCSDPPMCMSVHWPNRRGVHASLNQFTGTRWTAHPALPETGPISSITSDADGKLWVGTAWGGGRYFDGAGWQSFTTSAYPLASNDINVIRVDAQGDIWFGTANAGISRFKPPPPTPTPTPSDTPTETGTPTSTATETETPTPTSTLTGRETETASVTPTVDKTLTPSGTPATETATASPTATGPAKPTDTVTPTPTGTPVRAHRIILPMALKNFALSQAPTPRPTGTPTATRTPTATATATPRESYTPTSSPTSTETASPSSTTTPTSTVAPTATETPTPSPTSTVTETPTPSQTPTVTQTPTITPTPTPTVPPVWQVVPPVTTRNLNDVFFVSPSTGWAVGDAGTILRSTDGGRTWAPQQTCAANKDLNAVFFVDANEGWVGGDANTMCRTVNGGSSWTAQQVSGVINHDVMALFMLSNTDGWAGTIGAEGGGAILRYDGTRWSRFDGPTASYEVTGIHLLSASLGWGTSRTGHMLRYTDAGWTPRDRYSGVLYDLDLLSSTDGWAVGSSSLILHYDGSEPWDQVSRPTGHLYGVDMVIANDGWAVGDRGLMLRYNGSNWQLVTSPTTRVLQAIQMWSASLGWAVGESGTVLRYGSP